MEARDKWTTNTSERGLEDSKVSVVPSGESSPFVEDRTKNDQYVRS